MKNPLVKPSLSINERFSTIKGSTIEGFQCISDSKREKNTRNVCTSLTDISGSPDRSGKVLENFCSVIHIELGSFFGTHF